MENKEKSVKNYVRYFEDFTDRYGSFINICKFAPIIPSASTIQNKTNEPIKGVTIIGKIVPKINGPLIFLATALRLKAIIKPNKRTQGVTMMQ